ncbi:MAG: ATP synthase F1 subunit delta [Firmicutes bacterium]|nr:ATP synthase F1 subunit delta [Bacillota bacterium]
MMKNGSPQISKRYAEALFEVVPEAERRLVSEEFKQTLEILHEPEVHRVFTHPRTSMTHKQQMIRHMKLSKILENFLLLVIEKAREAWLTRIEEEFERLVLASEQTTIAEVTSAIDLTEEAIQDLNQKLTKLTGKTILIRTDVDPRIGGGLIIKVDGKVIDGSVKHTLTQLQRKLIS